MPRLAFCIHATGDAACRVSTSNSALRQKPVAVPLPAACALLYVLSSGAPRPLASRCLLTRNRTHANSLLRYSPLAQQPEQQVLGPNVLVREPCRFFRGVRKHALVLIAERQVQGSRDLLPRRRLSFNFLPDRIGVQTLREPIAQRLVLAQQPQQQV